METSQEKNIDNLKTDEAKKAIYEIVKENLMSDSSKKSSKKEKMLIAVNATSVSSPS